MTQPDESRQQSKDTVYADAQDNVEPFAFNEQVADVFENMISRSVPGYGTLLELAAMIGAQYVKPNTRVYDLGSSLGAVTLRVRHEIPDNCEIVAVDNSEAMVKRSRAAMERDDGRTPVTVLQSDLQTVAIQNASLVIMNYTLQFIPPEQRPALLSRIAESLNPGGVLLIAEKVTFNDKSTNEKINDLHYHFKRMNGYSDLEIAQKRTALENVMVPDTCEVHHTRLLAAGFSKVIQLTQHLNFVSFLAIR